MAYQPKTKKNDASVDKFLQSVDETKRGDSYALIAMMRDVSSEEPKMWGASIIGFGSYHYISKSKSEGDWMKIGFSPRKAAISLYLSCDINDFADELAELGTYTHGKGCLYIKRLSDVNRNVLQAIVQKAYTQAKDVAYT